METPTTLIEAVRYFSDLDTCQEYMASLKWPDGKPTCPKCGEDRVGYISTRRVYKCMGKECHKQFSAKVGTIFKDSPLGLDKWFVAVWSIANAKNGISSCELARTLGVTQKTAWFMLHRIRHEEAWRFNARRTSDGKRFDAAMRGVFGKRLMFRQLCAIGDYGFMGIK